MLKLIEPGEVTVNPSELLGIILQAVLEDRSTEEEIDCICTGLSRHGDKGVLRTLELD